MPVTALAMEAILDYAYLGKMKLNPMNAVEVLKAIDFFSMMDILQICADFVVAHAMTVENVIPLRSFFICARLCGHEQSANNFIKVFRNSNLNIYHSIFTFRQILERLHQTLYFCN